MKKRDEVLKGGLNALLGGGSQKQKAAPTEPEPEQADAIQTSETPEADGLLDTISDTELKEALRQRRMRKRGRPRKDEALRAKEEELYTRSTWIMRRDLIAKLKEISLRETLTLKEIMEQITSDAIKAYESKHGEVIPRDHRADASSVFK